jgi:hypothetical protein
MMRTKHGTRILIACLLVVGIWQSALAGGKSCGRCGGHKELKSVYRLVKVCRQIDMPEYAYTKQEVFYPDKGAVCYPGLHCDTFHTLWQNCDCKTSCQSYTICSCQTRFGAKSTGHDSGCGVRQPYAVSKLTVPVLKWEVVHRCKDCCKDAAKRTRK